MDLKLCICDLLSDKWYSYLNYLQAKRILSLDVGLLIAGAKERGELESRVTNIIREVREAGQSVVHSEMLPDTELLHLVMNEY